MKTELIILISFAAAFAGFIIGAIIFNWPEKGEIISVVLTSAATDVQYRADRYYIDKHYTPKVRIWNHYTAQNEWYPIWQFKNPLLIMAQIDPEYTKANIAKLVGSQSVYKLYKDERNDRW